MDPRGSSSGATPTLVGSKRKRNTKGKNKIPIERIQNYQARQLRFKVTLRKLGKFFNGFVLTLLHNFRIHNVLLRQLVSFSKRRQGLFKKASELSVLCGARIAVIVFSEAGRPYSAIHHPSDTPSILDEYISSPQLPGHASQPDSLTDVTMQVSELNALLAAEKAKEETLKMKIDGLRVRETIWGAHVENLSLEELKVVKSRLSKVMADMAARADQPIVSSSDGEEMTAHDASGVSVSNMGTSCKEGHVSDSVIEERNYVSGSDQRLESGGVSHLEVTNREVQEEDNVSDEIDLELQLGSLYLDFKKEIDLELKL